MAYKRIEKPHYHKTATTTWTEQVDANFESLWEDRPSFRLYKNASTSTTNTILKYPGWTTERWNNGGFSWTSGINAVEVPLSGFYYCFMHVDWAANTSGTRLLSINGAADVMLPGSSGYCSQTMVVVLYLPAGSDLTGGIWQSSGGSLNANPGSASQLDKMDFGAIWLGDDSYEQD